MADWLLFPEDGGWVVKQQGTEARWRYDGAKRALRHLSSAADPGQRVKMVRRGGGSTVKRVREMTDISPGDFK